MKIPVGSVAALFLAGAVAAPHVAWADAGLGDGEGRGVDRATASVLRRGSDTTYGRIDGDLSLAVGAGVAVGPRAPRMALDLRLRFLETAGILLAYEDGATFGTGSEPARLVAAGVELRPLFLARWLQGLEMGRPRLDLFIDSLGLEVGAFFQQPIDQSLSTRAGLQLALGLEFPLYDRASGPWVGLHGGLRLAEASFQGGATGPLDRAAFIALTLAWHTTVSAHIVDLADTRPR